MTKHLRGRRMLLRATIVVCCLTPHSLSLEAQEARPVFSSGVAVVPITAVVRDSRNRIVRALGKNDFQVLENDEPRPIIDFRATDRAPLSLALLVDTSGSMRGPNLDRSKRVVDRLLQSIDRAEDEVALFTFDKTLRHEAPFGNNPERVRTALDRTEAWGLTSLYDAIAHTAKQLGDRRSQRRAVIVITDGVDTSSTLTPPEVSGRASAIDVPVYVISVVPPNAPESSAVMIASDHGLSSLASWTGGDVSHATSQEQMDSAIDSLMAELRQQYFIAIESAVASGWHRLDVRTKRKGLTVRARSGYFATSLSGESGR